MSYEKKDGQLYYIQKRKISAVKSRITTLTRKAQEARHQAELWLKTTSILEKELAELLEVVK